MTQEEKAKAYDEAIDKVAHFIKKHIGFGCMIHPNSSEAKELFNIFPELKESEDERIFEEIYKDLHTYYMMQRDKFVLTDIKEIWDDKWSKAKAWLEKQDENMGISEATKQKLEDNLNKALEKETPESWNEFLDEQKPAEYTLEQAAGIFLDALSNTPYNNKPITDAQVITKELLKFLADTSSYNPNAINEQNPISIDLKNADVEFNNILKDKVSFETLKMLLETWWKNTRTIIKEQEPVEWSEKDEKILKETIVKVEYALAGQGLGDFIDRHPVVLWLKSLKDRVQPKQELGEEDSNMLQSILDEYKSMAIEKRSWLKSLKERYAWKPSDEQVNALEFFVRSVGESGYASPYDNNTRLLQSLVEQLKKLKG